MPHTNAQARDLNNLFHPYTDLKLLEETGPLIIERGQGVRVYDTAGRDYIEALSGLWCTALGWGDNELAETAAEQMRKLSYGHVFAGKSHEPAAALAENAAILATLRAVDRHLCIHSHTRIASTDANIPLSLGIEAVSIGSGGSGGGVHTPQEWFDASGRDLALRRILLFVLAAARTEI